MIIYTATSSFTRPNNATPYAAGQLIANSTVAGSVVPLRFRLLEKGFFLLKTTVLHSSATTANANFKVHYYGSSPTVTNGDGGVWLSTNSNYQCSMTIDATALTFSNSGSGFLTNPIVTTSFFMVPDFDTYIYGLIEARAAYVPAANEVFTVTLSVQAQ